MFDNLTTGPRFRFVRKRNLDSESENIAKRTLLMATELFAKAAARYRRRKRNTSSEVAQLTAQLQSAEQRAFLAERTAELLRLRWFHIPGSKRPHYEPHQRFEILQLRRVAGWNRIITAEKFAVSTGTISEWEGKADQESETVGSLVKPVAPIRRIADIVRSLVQTMHCAKFGGAFVVATLVARAGWMISERSIERIRAEAFIRPPSAMLDDIDTEPPSTPVITRFVHHTWMLDLSPFHTLGDGGDLWLGGVFDAHSRTPLILKTYPKRPGAAAMAALFRAAIARFQKPKYVITDLGVEFKGVFAKAVNRVGSILRRCVKENRYATARLERFWRTLKQLIGYRISFPSDIHDLDRRLAMALAFYLQKPHKGLERRAPIDVFRAILDRAQNAIPAPRGSPGQGSRDPPFHVRFLDPQQQRLPILVPAC